MAYAENENWIYINVTPIDQTQHPVRHISMYPNPSTGLFYLATEGNVPADQVRIFDLVGREIYRTQPNQYLTYIDITTCPSGIYMLLLTYRGQVPTSFFIEKI